MAGLLGTSWEDPRTMAALQLAQGLMGSPKLMQGAAQGMQGYAQVMAQSRQQQQMEEMRKLQLQQAQMQMAQQQREAERQQKLQALAGQFQRTPQQMAMGAEGKGPTQSALTASQGMPGGFDFTGYAQALAGIDPMAGLQLQGMLRKETPQPVKLGAGEVLFDPVSGKPVFSNPKEADLPSAVREYQFAQQQGYRGSFQQFQLEQKRAGATNVSVPINTGQKGFDNTLKLRGEFKSEPVYKAHQEMTSAYSQIKQALGQQSPAGDLAGATKIMKLLDPGSVVRESELGMAMAATGLLDRVQNYAGMIANGTKLTPSQRKDFQQLADRLYSESVNQYNAKRGEYQGIAERNQLNVPDVLGGAAGNALSVDDLLKKYGGK